MRWKTIVAAGFGLALAAVECLLAGGGAVAVGT